MFIGYHNTKYTKYTLGNKNEKIPQVIYFIFKYRNIKGYVYRLK